MIAVDGNVAFITGLCVGNAWVGDPDRGIAPWRDTGIEICGPAVAEVERAFTEIWGTLGPPVPEMGVRRSKPAVMGEVNMRVVATLPATAGMFRLDQLVAAISRERLWLTDAYFAGTTPYVQALRAAALDGVDVRLLVPGGSDLPWLRPLTRAGYRPLLDAGVRVFEWNGPMLHAKTAVADDRWARVGSTNLNLASWLGNCELDAVIEDEGFARQMEDRYLVDLWNATEIVLDQKARTRRLRTERPPRRRLGNKTGSAGRAAAGAVRIGNAIGAVFTSRRVLRPLEARFVMLAALLIIALSAVFTLYPHVIAYPAAALFLWIGLATLCRGVKLQWQRKRKARKS
jgi:cardiolipin synthase